MRVRKTGARIVGRDVIMTKAEKLERRLIITIGLVLCGVASLSFAEDQIDSFLGGESFERQRLFDDQRYPNVVVTTRGTVLSVWGLSLIHI